MKNSLNTFVNQMGEGKLPSDRMPVLFIGHGNPMNAIEKNEYHLKWKALSSDLPKPRAILVISAHWLTKGTYVTAMERPRTIHDFSGFPKELFDQQYPAPGTPELARLTQQLVKATTVQSDLEWGLDHGTWSFLLPMYPQADIPVYQLSLDYYQPMSHHYQLAKELKALREKGVLIVGSGNMVHNLRLVSSQGRPYDWALEFDEKMKEYIENNDHQSILRYDELGEAAKLAVPTHDHFLPLIYSLGVLDDKGEEIEFFNEKVELKSVSMRSFCTQ